MDISKPAVEFFNINVPEITIVDGEDFPRKRYTEDQLIGLANKVAAYVLEEAAKKCDELSDNGIPAYGGYKNTAMAHDCAKYIRGMICQE